MKLIKGDDATLVTLGTLNWRYRFISNSLIQKNRMGVGLLCLLATACLILRNFKGAFIVTITGTSIIIVVIEAIFFRDLLTFDVNQFSMKFPEIFSQLTSSIQYSANSRKAAIQLQY